jgi:hypothetical protein
MSRLAGLLIVLLSCAQGCAKTPPAPSRPALDATNTQEALDAIRAAREKYGTPPGGDK